MQVLFYKNMAENVLVFRTKENSKNLRIGKTT